MASVYDMANKDSKRKRNTNKQMKMWVTEYEAREITVLSK
jgi:hypothetical protein